MALYFCFFKDIHEIFEYDELFYKDIIYCQWLLYVREGILGLSLYDEDLKRWGHSNTQGAWIFVNFLLENQIPNQKILEIEFDEDAKKLDINLDK